MPEPHIMLFDLYAGGHHGQYIRQIAQFWAERGLKGRLDIAVPEHFLDVHHDLRSELERHRDRGVRLAAFQASPQSQVNGLVRRPRADHADGRVLKREVDRIRPDHCVLMYLDRFQLPLATDLRFRFPVRLSGIFFRPSFHYKRLQPVRPMLGQAPKEAVKRWLLSAALRNPHFSTLFSLDPFFVPFVRPPRPSVSVVHLPDGIVLRPPRVSIREIHKRFGVQPGRRVLLLFGALDRRKGYFELLEAIRSLPEETCRRLALLLVGPVPAADRLLADGRLRQLRSERPVQIVERDAFVPDEEIQDLIRAADLVLLPYQRHVGSSMILVRAAHAEIPVLGPDYGAMGATIRGRRLGYALDTTSPEAIGAQLASFVEDPTQVPFDADAARRFASENTADKMAAVLFRHLGFPAPALN